MHTGRGSVFVGFDPGGKSAVAVLVAEHSALREARVATVDSVDDAMAWVRDQVGTGSIIAAGVDALLFWETKKSGWRGADRWLQNTYPDCRKSVICANSLYGAMAVQGMAFAMRLRQAFPDVALLETHPKVLYVAKARARYPRDWPDSLDARKASDWLRGELGLKEKALSFASDHEWDAALSAWVAWSHTTRPWPRDLVSESPDRSDILMPAGPVDYPWPT
ncbi:DUF429 domain-containing protein [Rhodospira trueperi]|uniref:Holliday junction resolvasome RuvABC endonuclease subunit n=1 Tax=Rhodospira trueperi TaxID=69960 RepID=A0A1G6WHT2_9PROT|nr:DUF429 domain-containing protein [Rhodospira trueperi]SDD64645.1 Protein of unknown function [Rhodospira trueperi]